MAHIKVYYRDLLKDEVELQPGVTTIGRSIDSDIKIDNAGVSAFHAKIISQDEGFLIEDTASRNGTFVNGERVSRQPLQLGDEIEIFKHTLKLSAAGTPLVEPHSQEEESYQVLQDATMEVDVSSLDGLVEKRQARNEAYLLLTDAKGRCYKYSLVTLNFKIGRATDADMRTPGIFAPKVAATVIHRSDGYYLSPEKRGHVRINGLPIICTTRLNNGDVVKVRGLSLKFYMRPPE